MSSGAPIFRFNEERATLISRTIQHVAGDISDPLHVLNDAAFHETRRLDGTKRPKDIERLEGWRQLARSVGRMSDAERQRRLQDIVTEYAHDVAGNFDPRVYRFSTKLMPTLVTSLLNPSSLPDLVRHPARLFSLDALGDKVLVKGPIERLRRLAKKGTLVFVPTHSSNMDSIVFGFALERSGLPPATYGAGKNLFTNPILSFFMHNLGAYRVDRRLRHGLYKRVLKAYSTVLIENGYHSLFFPGGTRARSGAIEQRLKLGLMGTGLDAYVRTLLTGSERRVFFVPATINYLITLEARTLIADHLSAAGKERYIIEDDESARPSRVATFASKLLGMNGSVVIRFAGALDPFGNQVDDDGVSRDARGRPVDPSDFVRDLGGEVVPNTARDAQYTRELGREIAAAYTRHTEVMATNVVAAACFTHLRARAPSSDLFNLLRLRDVCTSRDELARESLRVRDELLDLERSGDVHVSDSIRDCGGGDILAQALNAFAGYHRLPPAAARPDGVLLADTNLLYFYQNRLLTYGLGWPGGGQRGLERGRA